LSRHGHWVGCIKALDKELPRVVELATQQDALLARVKSDYEFFLEPLAAYQAELIKERDELIAKVGATFADIVNKGAAEVRKHQDRVQQLYKDATKSMFSEIKTAEAEAFEELKITMRERALNGGE
jgi:hypothetical protein